MLLQFIDREVSMSKCLTRPETRDGCQDKFHVEAHKSTLMKTSQSRAKECCDAIDEKIAFVMSVELIDDFHL